MRLSNVDLTWKLPTISAAILIGTFGFGVILFTLPPGPSGKF
jgi:nitrate reductase NapE component